MKRRRELMLSKVLNILLVFLVLIITWQFVRYVNLASFIINEYMGEVADFQKEVEDLRLTAEEEVEIYKFAIFENTILTTSMIVLNISRTDRLIEMGCMENDEDISPAEWDKLKSLMEILFVVLEENIFIEASKDEAFSMRKKFKEMSEVSFKDISFEERFDALMEAAFIIDFFADNKKSPFLKERKDIDISGRTFFKS
ncbi:MAG: hypothetical protein PHX98_01950 [Candidatus Moranbacteria bacterium]|nr:hypothetical protein [Candidatus Moranbacteria bacterium]